jgi:hypothetical protein
MWEPPAPEPSPDPEAVSDELQASASKAVVTSATIMGGGEGVHEVIRVSYSQRAPAFSGC